MSLEGERRESGEGDVHGADGRSESGDLVVVRESTPRVTCIVSSVTVRLEEYTGTHRW